MNLEKIYEQYIEGRDKHSCLTGLRIATIQGFNAARELHPHEMKFIHSTASSFISKISLN